MAIKETKPKDQIVNEAELTEQELEDIVAGGMPGHPPCNGSSCQD